MADIDLDAYLARVDYGGSRQPSLDSLTALHAAHVTAIPFENLDILLGGPISLDLDALQAKLVAGAPRRLLLRAEHAVPRGAGGPGLPTWIPLAARVRMGARRFGPRTHMLLRVELAGSAPGRRGLRRRRPRASAAAARRAPRAGRRRRPPPAPRGRRSGSSKANVAGWTGPLRVHARAPVSGRLRDGEPLHEHLPARSSCRR